mmetsp:Transcript_15083/g.47086  ORF Transcript_15083/g.47086 Transcript_15083/m.47086 type:complete len:294 (+) Transcript_15083:434-1315(+)
MNTLKTGLPLAPVEGARHVRQSTAALTSACTPSPGGATAMPPSHRRAARPKHRYAQRRGPRAPCPCAPEEGCVVLRAARGRAAAGAAARLRDGAPRPIGRSWTIGSDARAAGASSLGRQRLGRATRTREVRRRRLIARARATSEHVDLVDVLGLVVDGVGRWRQLVRLVDRGSFERLERWRNVRLARLGATAEAAADQAEHQRPDRQRKQQPEARRTELVGVGVGGERALLARAMRHVTMAGGVHPVRGVVVAVVVEAVVVIAAVAIAVAVVLLVVVVTALHRVALASVRRVI